MNIRAGLQGQAIDSVHPTSGVPNSKLTSTHTEECVREGDIAPQIIAQPHQVILTDCSDLIDHLDLPHKQQEKLPEVDRIEGIRRNLGV